MNDSQSLHDLLVIGGGINGAGIAADAAGRGLDVVLCEKSDLAAATSSWSTKLIHGGLRYLEHYEFALVRKSLQERELLAGAAPHLIRPLAFRIPQLPQSRSPWLIRAGLFLYDHLAARNRFPASRAVRFTATGPLRESIDRGFEYWDAQVDDSRLVIVNAQQARHRGARIMTRTRCVGLEAGSDAWLASLRDQETGEVSQLHCRAVINASGPWVSQLAEALTNAPAPHDIRLVKGSHIVVPRLYAEDHAMLLQHDDGRVVFVIPYLGRFSLIGTTEAEFAGDLDRVSISAAEIDYLIAIVNRYFKPQLSSGDVLHSYAGVRPLIDDGEQAASRVSRDYRIELSLQPYPLMSIYGGKVTTYRVLAESALNKLRGALPHMGPAWTADALLPGADFTSLDALRQRASERYPWLAEAQLERMLGSYGCLLFEVLGEARSPQDLGISFGAGLSQREVDYLRAQEWARSGADVLWRRTKLGYDLNREQVEALNGYF